MSKLIQLSLNIAVQKAQTFGGARAMACSPVPKVGGAAAPSAAPVPTPMTKSENKRRQE